MGEKPRKTEKMIAVNQREKLCAIEGRTCVGTASEKWPHLKGIKVERMKTENGGETKKGKSTENKLYVFL